MKQAAIPPLDVSVQIKDAKAGCKNLNEHALELSQVFVIWSHLGMEEYFSNVLEFNDKDKTVSMPGWQVKYWHRMKQTPIRTVTCKDRLP